MSWADGTTNVPTIFSSGANPTPAAQVQPSPTTPSATTPTTGSGDTRKRMARRKRHGGAAKRLEGVH